MTARSRSTGRPSSFHRSSHTQARPIEPPERLEVLEVDTSNVTVLRKRDDPSPV
jgi:hypothetical protein